MTEEEYREQVERVADILQQTVAKPNQQSDTLLDVLAGFFEEVSNVTTSTGLRIPPQVREQPSSRAQLQPLFLPVAGAGGVREQSQLPPTVGR